MSRLSSSQGAIHIADYNDVCAKTIGVVFGRLSTVFANVRSEETNRAQKSEVTMSHCTEMHYQKLRAFGLFQLLTMLVQQLRGRVKIVLSVQCFSPVHYTCTQGAHVNFCVGPTRP